MQRFIPKKIPIHSFYLDGQPFFENISRKTIGKAQKFNINSKTQAEDMAKFLIDNIFDVVNKKQLNPYGVNLHQAYLEKFCRGIYI